LPHSPKFFSISVIYVQVSRSFVIYCKIFCNIWRNTATLAHILRKLKKFGRVHNRVKSSTRHFTLKASTLSFWCATLQVWNLYLADCLGLN
jgi:hypothetical protein